MPAPTQEKYEVFTNTFDNKNDVSKFKIFFPALQKKLKHPTHKPTRQRPNYWTFFRKAQTFQVFETWKVYPETKMSSSLDKDTETQQRQWFTRTDDRTPAANSGFA